MKKTLIILFILAPIPLAICALSAISGFPLWVGASGQASSASQTAVPATRPDPGEGKDLLKETIEELEKKAFAAEIFSGGKSARRWSQDGKGSWRLERSADPIDPVTIYNASKKKGWLVRGETAYEITDSGYLQSMYRGMSPIASVLNAAPARSGRFAQAPKSAGADGIWEWDFGGGLRIEFKGPEGLLSKIIVCHNAGKRGEQSVEYMNLGSVPSDLFELPAGVQKVKPYEDLIKELESSGVAPKESGEGPCFVPAGIQVVSVPVPPGEPSSSRTP